MIRFWPLHSDRGMTVTGVVHADLFGPMLIQTRTEICPWSLFLLPNVDAPRKRQSLERMHKFGGAVRSKRHLPVALLSVPRFPTGCLPERPQLCLGSRHPATTRLQRVGSVTRSTTWNPSRASKRARTRRVPRVSDAERLASLEPIRLSKSGARVMHRHVLPCLRSVRSPGFCVHVEGGLDFWAIEKNHLFFPTSNFSAETFDSQPENVFSNRGVFFFKLSVFFQ